MKKPKTTLVVSRFAVPVKLAAEFICGGVSDQFYTEFSLTTRGLTAEGFVTEVKGLIDAIKEAYRPSSFKLKASCEELASGVLHVIARTVGRRLVAADVIVENFTGQVRLEWVSGEEIPSFPRAASTEEENEPLRRPTC